MCRHAASVNMRCEWLSRGFRWPKSQDRASSRASLLPLSPVFRLRRVRRRPEEEQRLAFLALLAPRGITSITGITVRFPAPSDGRSRRSLPWMLRQPWILITASFLPARTSCYHCKYEFLFIFVKERWRKILIIFSPLAVTSCLPDFYLRLHLLSVVVLIFWKQRKNITTMKMTEVFSGLC